MPRTTNQDETALFEEAEDLLKGIPRWISKSMIIAVLLVTVTGTAIFFVFNSVDEERSSQINVYPKLTRVYSPYLSRIDSIFDVDGKHLLVGDTICRVLNVEYNRYEHIVLEEFSGNFIANADLRKGSVIEQNTSLGILLKDSLNYILLGKLKMDGQLDSHNYINKKLIVYNDTYKTVGTTEGINQEKSDIIFTIPLESEIIRSFMVHDSVSMKIKNNQSKYPIFQKTKSAIF